MSEEYHKSIELVNCNLQLVVVNLESAHVRISLSFSSSFDGLWQFQERKRRLDEEFISEVDRAHEVWPATSAGILGIDTCARQLVLFPSLVLVLRFCCSILRFKATRGNGRKKWEVKSKELVWLYRQPVSSQLESLVRGIASGITRISPKGILCN